MTDWKTRFWKKVEKTGSCWNWTASRKNGYGQFSLNGRARKSTHVAWFIYYGTWPILQIQHHCDNRACVKKEHLYEGTQKENIRDMFNRGRARPHGIKIIDTAILDLI